ncbi:MAG: VOC family protein [Candidatus Peribacteraceae bacterium]|nr:VOC family protein [Candidatus Peribacteraceae bacterium]
MDKVIHFEIPVTDLQKARDFYGPIFGWALQDWTMPDGSIHIGVHTTHIDEATRQPKEAGAINGMIQLRNDKVKSPTFAVNVDSIDDRVAKVEKAGGKVIQQKVDIMGMGFYCYVQDPDGNVFGLWEDAKKA